MSEGAMLIPKGDGYKPASTGLIKGLRFNALCIKDNQEALDTKRSGSRVTHLRIQLIGIVKLRFVTGSMQGTLWTLPFV